MWDFDECKMNSVFPSCYSLDMILKSIVNDMKFHWMAYVKFEIQFAPISPIKLKVMCLRQKDNQNGNIYPI